MERGSRQAGRAIPLDRPPPRPLAVLLAFLRSQTAGGMALIAAAALALVWSNASGAANYTWLLALPLGGLSLNAWVNDGLMTLFFLVVGLEIRREIGEGQLSSRQQIAAPGLAAVGGMIVPALIYIGFNHADRARLHGWAVPVATDIAFVLASLSMLGRRVPVALKLFLTALAIFDDLGAIVIIALFYTSGLHWIALLAAGAVCLVLYGFNRTGIRAIWVYAAGGAVLWACVLRSGVHPTIAGVALACVMPIRDTGRRMQAALSPWVTWVVLPLFGLANAGLALDHVTAADFTTPMVLGTALGLVIGKPLGVAGATWVGIRCGVAQMPARLSWPHLIGGSLLCGIGFTMSLFIGNLGFHDSALHAEVKLAVFTGSAVSALLGLLVLRTRPVRRPPNSGRPAGTDSAA